MTILEAVDKLFETRPQHETHLIKTILAQQGLENFYNSNPPAFFDPEFFWIYHIGLEQQLVAFKSSIREQYNILRDLTEQYFYSIAKEYSKYGLYIPKPDEYKGNFIWHGALLHPQIDMSVVTYETTATMEGFVGYFKKQAIFEITNITGIFYLIPLTPMIINTINEKGLVGIQKVSMTSNLELIADEGVFQIQAYPEAKTTKVEIYLDNKLTPYNYNVAPILEKGKYKYTFEAEYFDKPIMFEGESL